MDADMQQLIAHLRQENNFLSTTINNLPHYIFWKDVNSVFLGCNQAFAQAAGRNSPAEIIGKTDCDMPWGVTDAEKYIQDDQSIIRSGIAKLSYEELQRADGTEKIIQVSKLPLYDQDDTIRGVLGIYNDITDIKRMQQLAESANKAKTEFLANLSHDLRTPLSSLLALNTYLAAAIKDEDLKWCVDDAKFCAQRMLELINEILEFTAVESGDMPQQDEPFQLQSLISSTIRLVTAAAQQKRLKIQFEDNADLPWSVYGKPKLIGRVLLNLLSNAIKFTKVGGITVTVRLIEQQSNQLKIRLSIKDTGIGIPALDQQKIFEKFERLTAAYTGSYQGFGLGLYIVKKFMDLLHGSITIDSVMNEGTTIHLDIPLTISSSEPITEFNLQTVISDDDENAIKTDALVYDVNKNKHVSVNNHILPKILFVEDNDIAQRVGTMILEPLVSQIDIASTGHKAIELAKRSQYDLIFLDIGLPDMSGQKVAKAIRDYEIHHALVPVPIIALTAHLNPSDLHPLLLCGIQQIMRKPISKEKAEAAFNNWLMEKHTSNANEECFA